MTTTDTDYAARFPDVPAATLIANGTNLANYTPAANPFNSGMLSDIGRAILYQNDVFTDNPYNKFLRAPLTRGQAVMKGYFSEIPSRAYNPLAPDTDLFNGNRPSFVNEVYFKNYSRQIALEVNDRLIKQYVQTEDMAGSAQAAIMSSIASCAADDAFACGKTFFSGSTRSAKAGQMEIMTNGITDAGAGAEMVEKIWKRVMRDFKYKSSAWNANSRPGLSKNINVFIKKDWEWPSFRKLLSETFNPMYIDPTKFNVTFDFVDSFATPAGAPAGAGDLACMIVDNRVMDITPMPEGYVMETFRNPARHSTAFFQTTELAYGWSSSYNAAWIFEKP